MILEGWGRFLGGRRGVFGTGLGTFAAKFPAVGNCYRAFDNRSRHVCYREFLLKTAHELLQFRAASDDSGSF